MTVAELIQELEKVEDKSIRVLIFGDAWPVLKMEVKQAHDGEEICILEDGSVGPPI